MRSHSAFVNAIDRAVHDLVGSVGRQANAEERRRGYVPHRATARVQARAAQRVLRLAGNQRRGQIQQPIGRIGAAGVGTGDEVGFCCLDGHIAPARDRPGREFQAAGLVADRHQARILCRGSFKPLPRAVGRATVHDDHFRRRRSLREEARHHSANVLNFVEFRHHDTDRLHGGSIASHLHPHRAGPTPSPFCIWRYFTLAVDKDCAVLNNLPMFQRKSLISAVLIPLIVGLAGLMRLMSQPRFAAFRSVDVVQLTGSGMCFGVALFALILLLRTPRA